VGSALSQ